MPNNAEPTPRAILDDLWAARGAWVLIAGLDLDVFTIIHSGKRTPPQIARAAGASVPAMTRLLDALTGMEYLTKKGNRYGLAPVSRQYLVRTNPAYLGDVVDEARLTLDTWTRLPETVRTGRPQAAVSEETEAREFFPRLVRAIFPMSFGAASRAAASLPQSTKRRTQAILDVAAGAAPWSIPMALAMPSARVTAQDFPEVLDVAREYTARFHVDDRYEFLEGNLREVNFGRDAYDMVLLGHIIHSEGARWGKKLIQKCYRALGSGGVLLIAEMVPNDARNGPAMPLIFGINMLLHTTEGDVFTMKEYRSWLKEAGFRRVSKIDAGGPSPLILATK